MSDEQTPQAETPPVVETPAEPDPPPTEEAAIDQSIEEHAIDLPDNERLVPVNKVVGPLRAKLRESKAEAERLKADADRAAALESENQALKARWQEAAPAVQAALEIVNGRQQPAAPVQTGPTEAETTELSEIARDFDLWKPDGTPDLERAGRIRAREQRTAEAIAAKATAPIVLNTMQRDAMRNLERAKLTAAPDGSKPDADILEGIWARMATTPQGLQSLSDENTARYVWNQAYTETVMRRASKPAPNVPAVAAAPPPLHRETPGGPTEPTVNLDANDKRIARELGITDKEYAATAAKMPWARK